MYSKSSVTEYFVALMDFDLWEITGRWVSTNGAPAVNIYRNTSRKGGGTRLEFTYNNPQAVFDCAVKAVFGQHYIELYGRLVLTYDREREVLSLSAYGEYLRAEDSAE